MSRTLLLLHGYSGSKADFAHVMPGLERVARVLAYDQRGHGEARDQVEDAPLTLENLAEDLRVRLDREGVAKANVLGHSMGGMIALRFALMFPERTESLILVGTGPNSIDMGPPVEFSQTRAWVRRDLAAKSAPALFAPPEQRALWEKVVRKGHRAANIQAMAQLQKQIAEIPSLTPRLSQIKAPTTVMVGDHDAAFRCDAEEMARALPNARFVLMKHSSHYPHFEQEAEFLRAIEDHFHWMVATKMS